MSHNLLLLLIILLAGGGAAFGALCGFFANIICLIAIVVFIIFLIEHKFIMAGIIGIILAYWGLNKLMDYLLYKKMTPEEKRLEDLKRYWRKTNRF